MSGLPRIAWVGLAILALAAIMLSLGKRETQSFPTADSFAPSGSAALAALLEQQGYRVSIDRSLRPKLHADDLVIAFEIAEPPTLMEAVQEGVEEGSDTPHTEFDKPFNKELLSFLKSGGRALILPIDTDYLAASKAVLSAPIPLRAVTGGQPLQVNMAGSQAEVRKATEELTTSFTTVGLWHGPDGDSMVDGVRVGEGTAFVLWNGIIGTNRFIDRADNAALLLQLASVLAPKGSRVVFTEAAFGNVEEKGFLQALGAWADAAWQQLLLLAAVVIYTLGKRLGLPDESKGRQRGTRELVDALADTMNRTHATNLALTTALTRADAELRMALKLPRETERSRRDELLSQELKIALTRVEAAAAEKETSSTEAARLVRRLDEEMSVFLGARRLATPRKS
ncbi:MAG: DUF4350 domain-containing protein [Fimbriimonas sp.]